MHNTALLTPEQVAERLHLEVSTIGTWLRSGKLRGKKLGRVWRVRPEDLEAFIDAAPGNDVGEGGSV